MRTLCRLIRRGKGKKAKVEGGVKLPESPPRPPKSKVVVLPAEWANAPQRQPCPGCRRWVKRISKSEKMAKYYCGSCNIEMIASLRPRKKRWWSG